jgi:hypothetical protein
MAEMLEAAKRVGRLTQELKEARADLRVAVRGARDSGDTVSEIARQMGVSRTRVHQLLAD